MATNRAGTFNFTISGVSNPISTEVVDGIIVTTQTSDEGVIDTGTSSWSVPNSHTITGAQWSVTGTQTQVSALSQQRVLFSLPFPVEALSEAEVIFPNDISLTDDLVSYTGFNLFRSGNTFENRNETGVRIGCSISDTPFNTTNAITFSLIGNPESQKATGSLQINLYTATGGIIASVTDGVILDSSTLTSGEVLISQVVPQNSIVQENGIGYSFTFRPGQ